jgi:hypothetical protein
MKRDRALAVCLFVAALATGCAQLPEKVVPLPPAAATLLDDLRSFEQRIGFAATGNFAALSAQRDSYTVCGIVSPHVLPYSYQDPAISWHDVKTREECFAVAPGADVYFDSLEARGESATPLTSSLAGGNLERFVYVVIHEDCHDQFAFPYGFEEALCNLIAYKAMSAFALERYGAGTPEEQAISAYAGTQARRDHGTTVYYNRIAALYSGYARGEMEFAELLARRRQVFQSAREPQAWAEDALNNVGIANHMTYSRHYPFCESVFDALGGDLRRAIAFFKQVDASRPSSRIDADHKSVAWVRAQEEAVLLATRAALTPLIKKPEEEARRAEP